MATSATTMSFFMVPPWVDAGDRPCVRRNAPRRRSLARRTRSPAGDRVWPIGGVIVSEARRGRGPALASGQRGGLWAGSGGAHVRGSRRTTPGRATRDSSTACAPGLPPPSPGSTSGTPPGIYNLALRVVRHGPDAEDITQDVLIRAFERLPRDREVLLRPWLYRLTLNRCYDYLRGSARRPLPVATGADLPSPQDPYEQSELQRLLEGAIGDLTRRQRAALLLKDVHGLSLVEVAACLDLTPGSVEVLLARARQGLPGEVRGALHRRRPAAAALRRRPRRAAAAAAARRPGRAAAAAPLAARAARARAADRGAVPAAHRGGRERHRRRARSAGVPQDGRADRRRRGDRGHGRDRGHAGRPSPAARRRRRGRARRAGACRRRARHRREREPAGARRRPRRPVAPSPSPSAAASPEASPSPTEVAEPTPQGSPLAIATPTPSPEPSATPTPTDTPTAHATTPPATPSPDPSATASPSASASPSPIATP